MRDFLKREAKRELEAASRAAADALAVSIKRVALMTVEGEYDDISAVGQTEAAHRLCTHIPPGNKVHYVQPGVGHYGVFNGSRFRAEIAPRIADFVLSHNGRRNLKSHGEAHAGAAKLAAVEH